MKMIFLPGLGADSRMYPRASYAHLPDVVFAEWPKYAGEKTLADVADSVIRQYGIDQDTVIGGSSLGGMVSLEIAKSLGLATVLLVGSARHPSFVNPALNKLHNLAEITPIKMIQLLAGKLNKISERIVFSMFEQADTDFIRAMCRAIFEWEGIGGYQGKVCHIHGSSDQVIYPPKDNVEIIQGGGHLISMTHSRNVADFIETIRNCNR